MSVVFLTAPSVPPAEALPELARVPSGERPELLVAHAATAREWLAVLGRLEAFGIALRQSERSPADPLVAVWVGDPTENPEPLSLVADLILLGGGWNLLREIPMISVSLACFVPRPWTPLQWWPIPGERELKDQIARVARGLEGIHGVTVTHDLPKWALLEGCLSRGDRRAGGLFLTVHRVGWEGAVVQSPLNPAFILHRPRPADEILPWDHLEWGIDRARLRARYEALLSATGAGA